MSGETPEREAQRLARDARFAADRASAQQPSPELNRANLFGDLDARADYWHRALCAVPRSSATTRSAWRRALNLPFRTDPASLTEIKQLCQRCPLTTTCRDQGVGAEYGVWGGELHQPELADELGAGATAASA
jgi:hypothetical protein